ncbi:MAG TPA: prephenate dehydratase [Flavisolibacter sp.]|jgi:prephenate dehydratase|nr:prephenate dehydratase [Flavisolibacter sp.]
MANKVSIQGFEGSFHQIAARQFFGLEIGILPCATFREVIDATKKGQTDASVMAIENSIAGSILPNYHLLHKSGLCIIGEVYLPIKQHLLVNPGVKLEDIKEVHSHPIAILQCMDFLTQHNWKLVETEDTALSAKHIHQRKSKHIAGVAGKLAAELFQLEIAAENIHTEKNNYTRFLVLQKTHVERQDADKASLSFHTDHSRGSLARVLTKIADRGINLSKLQSFPIPSNAWQYNFHADLEFDSLDQLKTVLKEIIPVTEAVNVYGIYKNGNAKSGK